MTFAVTILGCGFSGGVPRPGSGWGACDPGNPKNRRRRSSILVDRMAADGGQTRVLVDTSPDLREQLLDADVNHLDGVLYTHEHADHIHGIDDLRSVNRLMQSTIPLHADAPALAEIDSRFSVYELALTSESPNVQFLRQRRDLQNIPQHDADVFAALETSQQHGNVGFGRTRSETRLARRRPTSLPAPREQPRPIGLERRPDLTVPARHPAELERVACC